MELKLFIEGIIVGVSVSAPLGPLGVLLIQRTMNKGLLSAFFTGLGAAIADIIYAIIAGFGLTYISGFIDDNALYIRLIGSLLVFFLGVKIFFSNPAKQFRRQKTKKRTLVSDFLSSFFITISNPLTIVVFGYVFAGLELVSKDSNYTRITILLVGIFSGAMLWWGILIKIVNRFRSSIRLRKLWWINKITGASVVVLGIAIMIHSIFFM